MESKIVITLFCALTLTACCFQAKEPPQWPDPRDGHIKEFLGKAGSSKVKKGFVVITTQPVLAKQPFQCEALLEIQIPISKVAKDDIPCFWFAEGHLARTSFPANHIIRLCDLMPHGITEGWQPIHRAKKEIVQGELFTKENTIRRYVQISAKNATPDIFMHKATRPIRSGEIIHRSDIGLDLWEYVYYANQEINKEEVIDSCNIELRFVKASNLDEEWNYAYCGDTSAVYRATKDIKCGAPIRCSDIN